MRKIMLPLGFALIALASPAPAQSLAPAQPGTEIAIARQCSEQFATWWLRTHGVRCASCSADWPYVAQCTAETIDPKVDRQKLAACIQSVNDKYWTQPMSFDRISPALRCAGL